MLCWRDDVRQMLPDCYQVEACPPRLWSWADPADALLDETWRVMCCAVFGTVCPERPVRIAPAFREQQQQQRSKAGRSKPNSLAPSASRSDGLAPPHQSHLRGSAVPVSSVAMEAPPLWPSCPPTFTKRYA